MLILKTNYAYLRFRIDDQKQNEFKNISYVPHIIYHYLLPSFFRFRSEFSDLHSSDPVIRLVRRKGTSPSLCDRHVDEHAGNCCRFSHGESIHPSLPRQEGGRTRYFYLSLTSFLFKRTILYEHRGSNTRKIKIRNA